MAFDQMKMLNDLRKAQSALAKEIVEVEESKEEKNEIESPESQEKKFKLSNIKGMKAVQSLFDDDPLEEMIEEEKKQEAESGRILKSNVSTDFMEAKPRQEFRLDLNDKIAIISGSSIRHNQTDAILEIVTVKDVINR